MRIRRNLLLSVAAIAALVMSACVAETEAPPEELCEGAACVEVTTPGDTAAQDDTDPEATPDDEITDPVVDTETPPEDITDPEDPTDTEDPNDPEDIEVGTEDPPLSDLVEEGDLSLAEVERVEVLRSAIGIGLDLGRELYLDEVAIQLQDLGVANGYELSPIDPAAGLDVEVEACPFVQYYDNGFESSAHTCDYLADIAMVEVYSELTQEVDDKPLPEDISGSVHFDEAQFWYEQGAISALDEGRVQVRFDLVSRGLCNTDPTPSESSYAKGITIGRLLFADTFNSELAERGFPSTYPDMPAIRICNANQAFIEPAVQTAFRAVPSVIAAEPLCADYEPPTREAAIQFAQAEIDYERGVTQGLDDERALAVVSAFQVISCAVVDPLVVDLDGDGIELTGLAGGVDFDLWAIDRPQAVAWPAADDGFLALDRNDDGAITSGAELFGNTEGSWADGFEQLANLDDNGDGMVSAADAAFASLVVWRDANGDGESAADELITLAEIGVTAIPTVGEESDLVVNGNPVPVIGYTQGVSLLVGDAQLRVAPNPRLARAE